MRMDEHNLWVAFRRRCAVARLDVERVENVAAVGTPDVYILSSGSWVEMKAPTAPKRAATRLVGSRGLNRDQINWHIKAQMCGRKTYILIRDSNQRVFLVNGKDANDVNDWSAETLTVKSVATTWQTIMEILK